MADDEVGALLAGSGSMPADTAAELVDEVNHRTVAGLLLLGAAEHGGSGGAVYVRWPDGRDGVVTRTPTPVDRMQLTADVLAELRARGLPVPRHDLVVGLSDGTTAVVQERLPGAPPSRVDADVIDSMVAANERFAGLLEDRSEYLFQRCTYAIVDLFIHVMKSSSSIMIAAAAYCAEFSRSAHTKPMK